MLLDMIRQPSDLKDLSYEELDELAGEIRDFIVQAVAENGGHLGSNLGAVELTLALHRVFDSPRDVILWDTGHQAYVHKIVTGRQAGFEHLRQAGGLSGYPSREESPSTTASRTATRPRSCRTRYGLAVARDNGTDPDRRHIVAVIGDGSMTGGMAYEALNNLGHSRRSVHHHPQRQRPLVRADDRRACRESLTHDPRSTRVYMRRQRRVENLHPRAAAASAAGRARHGRRRRPAMREYFEPPAFFETLGVRYTGPFDGHDIEGLETALRNAAEFDGPIVVHVLTQKGRGYPPAEDDDEKHLHDAPVFDPAIGPPKAVPAGYTQAFTEAIIKEAEHRPEVVAITAAMPGPTGLLPFEERFPDRFFDVGIAEQHAVTAAAGMAMGGLRPVVAIYSTFLTRALDQVIYDVALHRQPVVFCIDRAGITGDDGPSPPRRARHGAAVKVPGMTVLAPSSAQELQVMLHDALDRATGPVPSGTRRARPARSPTRGRRRPAGRTGCARATVACASSPSASWSAAPSGPPQLLAEQGVAATRVGRPGRASRSTRR